MTIEQLAELQVAVFDTAEFFSRNLDVLDGEQIARLHYQGWRGTRHLFAWLEARRIEFPEPERRRFDQVMEDGYRRRKSQENAGERMLRAALGDAREI